LKYINLLPAKQKSRSRKPNLMQLLLLFTIVMLGVQFYFITTWRTEAGRVDQESLQLDLEMNQIRENGDLKIKVDGYKQAKQIIAKLEQDRIDWKPYLKSMIKDLPSTSKIVEISYGEKQIIQLEIDFNDPVDVIKYMKKLEDDDSLREVILTSFYKEKDDYPTAEVKPSNVDGKPLIKTTKKDVYKLKLDIEITQSKGAQLNGDNKAESK
jgi:Tfp pilus assembly protein PilN